MKSAFCCDCALLLLLRATLLYYSSAPRSFAEFWAGLPSSIVCESLFSSCSHINTLSSCKSFSVRSGPRLYCRAFCWQLKVVLHHDSILHHGHHPPWLDIIATSIEVEILILVAIFERFRGLQFARFRFQITPLYSHLFIILLSKMHHQSIQNMTLKFFLQFLMHII